MSQYELTVNVEYKYVVDANNEHDAVSIYINDHDSCIPSDGGKMNIMASKLIDKDDEIWEDN
jgi:hypothetical protein